MAPGRPPVARLADCKLPIAPEHADTVSELTGNLDIEIETYGDAAHAIRRWFALIWEPEPRH